MSVSADCFIYDREGDFSWGTLSDDIRDFHLEQVSELGSHVLGQRLH